MAADVNELISKIDKLIDRLDSRTSSRQTTRDGDDYFTAQEKNRKKYDEIRKDYETAEDLANVEKEYNEQRKKIAQKYADEILSNLDKHNKSKIALLNEEKEKELEILKAAGKDTTELEKEYTEKRKEILKSSLVDENKTVFEELNERFQKEYELYKEAGEDTYKIEKGYYRKRRQLFLQQTQSLVGAIQNLVNAGEAQVNDIANTWAVINQGAHDYGRVVGLTASQIEDLNEKTLSFWSDNDIAYKFNVSLDEFYKIMGAYNKELGRAVALTNDTMLNLVSMKNVLGEEQAIKFTANLDKFGLDVDATKELVEGITGDARRSGIVLSNLTQNVADNLHLAQQYTFEDGIEGLVKMAEKASAVKWNMQQTAAFAEKVNNIEGAIKTGAQLSVLGGPFAQFSNPMGMLYESLNDMEGLQDRIFAMFGNLGHWDKKKGMLDISVFDKQRIRAASAAMGLNYGDVINTVQSQARRNVVMDQIKGLGLDNNTTELIANTAQIDRDTGRAYVMYNDKKIFADQISKHKDKDKILSHLKTQANSPDENLRKIAQNTLGAKELAEAAVKEVMVDKADFYQFKKVTKSNFQTTVYAIEQTKAVLNQINIVLNAIQALVGVIAATSAFRGVLGGGPGAVGGAAGKVGLRQTLAGTPGVWGKTKALGKWASGNMAKYGGAALGISALGYAGSSLMDAQVERLRAENNHKDADNVNKGSGALNGMAQGAAIGSVGGLWGMLIGGVAGGVVGLFTASAENAKLERQRKEEEYNKQVEEKYSEFTAQEKEDARFDFVRRTNLNLNGDYDPDFIRELMRGTNYLNTYHRNMLYENNDGDVWEQLKPVYAKGGVLDKGSTHSEGGMNVVDNRTGEIVAEVEKYEGIVPAKIMEKFGTVDNLINSAMRPLQPMGEPLMISSNNNSPINSSLNVNGSASVNVGGLIQLTMTGGQTYNIAEDPAAMRMIGDSVMKHIMTANQQIFNKTEFYRKM